MKSRKTGSGKFAGKGYYIALILCAAAIGISGYLYYRNEEKPDPQLQQPTLGVNATGSQDDLPVVGPQPTLGSTDTTPKPTVDGTKTPLKTGMPVSGQSVAGYAMDYLSYNPTTRDWRVHDGVDIAADAGSAVCAAADGTVYTVYEDETMGTTVVIKHTDGYITKYSSLAKEVSVAPGNAVKLGQAIGTVGNTALLESAVGDHVHFAVTCNDVPMDPMAFLKMS